MLKILWSPISIFRFWQYAGGTPPMSLLVFGVGMVRSFVSVLRLFCVMRLIICGHVSCRDSIISYYLLRISTFRRNGNETSNGYDHILTLRKMLFACRPQMQQLIRYISTLESTSQLMTPVKVQKMTAYMIESPPRQKCKIYLIALDPQIGVHLKYLKNPSSYRHFAVIITLRNRISKRHIRQIA